MAINGGTQGVCMAGPCVPPCGPGEVCVTLSGNHSVCVSRHCNPPCKGNEICVALNGAPICIPR